MTDVTSNDASPGQLASEVAKDLSTLVRQEIALAKAELQQEAKTAGVAAGAFGGAGFAGYFVLLFACTASLAVRLRAAQGDERQQLKWVTAAALLFGVVLIAEGFDQHVPKGYIYFAMGFSVFVEMLNLRLRTKGTGGAVGAGEGPGAVEIARAVRTAMDAALVRAAT